MPIWMLALAIVLFIFCICLLIVVGIFLVTGMVSVPWVRTRSGLARQMLELGGFSPGDHALDLGSGDGTIVFEAVRMGGSGEGIEQMRMLVWYARFKAWMRKLSPKAQFHRANIFKSAFPPAKIVTCYLFSEVNARLESRLRKSFPTGTRVVSRDFSFPTLSLIKKKSIDSTTLYLYEI